MRIVDTHTHASTAWFEPIETLVHQMDANDVDNAVLVQHRGMYDNSYFFECLEKFPDRFEAIVQVDPRNDDPAKTLEMLVNKGASGVRLRVDSLFSDQQKLEMWDKADELELVVSVLGSPKEFNNKEFEQIIATHPDAMVVIEHLGGIHKLSRPYNKHSKDIEAVMNISKYNNTFIKIPGLGEVFQRPERFRGSLEFDIDHPIYDMALESFGKRRMMWASDFPPCSSREGYTNALRQVRDYPGFSENDVKWVLGNTASKLWQFN